MLTGSPAGAVHSTSLSEPAPVSAELANTSRCYKRSARLTTFEWRKDSAQR